ncbi:MAG: GDP-mannose 4,6-dehydratase [Microthrixaceae bacterium]|nr:GDP-mannose 4,6-dehydratase [Microthrixaceae bacterium]
MRTLVTGANGFVGRHLVAHLRAAGDEVITTDRSEGGPDLLDAEGWARTFAAARPEVVFHLAGDADVGGSWKHARETFRINAEGTLVVLAAARDHGATRVVNVGSADVYGKVPADRLPITESHPLEPASPYAASKIAADYLGLQAWLGLGLEVIRVRPFNHIGPGQSDRFVAPAIAMRIARNEIDGGDEVPVGNLTPQRDLTDVRDVVRAYRLLADHGVPGEVYNVCSGQAVAISEIAEQLLVMATRPMRLVSDPELFRPVDLPVLVGDFSKLRECTGWQPEIPIGTTIKDLMEDCRSRLSD